MGGGKDPAAREGRCYLKRSSFVWVKGNAKKSPVKENTRTSIIVKKEGEGKGGEETSVPSP